MSNCVLLKKKNVEELNFSVSSFDRVNDIKKLPKQSDFYYSFVL